MLYLARRHWSSRNKLTWVSLHLLHCISSITSTWDVALSIEHAQSTSNEDSKTREGSLRVSLSVWSTCCWVGHLTGVMPGFHHPVAVLPLVDTFWSLHPYVYGEIWVDWKCRTWKWRTKNDSTAGAWNGMLNLYSVYSASNVRRLCALLCPAISFLRVHVLQFHVLHIGPSISRPSFSRPAFSAPPEIFPAFPFSPATATVATERQNGTAKRQRQNGNGMVETRHKTREV